MESKYKVNFEDLLFCGWQAVMPTAENPYETAWHGMNEAASEAAKLGYEGESRALQLLSAASSMFLREKSLNTPFGPMAEFGNRRSALPQDFAPSDLEAMGQAATYIEDPWLRARLADIVWLSNKPRDVKFGQLAYRAYTDIPLEASSWHFGAVDCWARGIAICRQLGRAEIGSLIEIEKILLEKARAAVSDDGFFLIKVSRLLKDGRMGYDHAQELAVLLVKAAESAGEVGDFHRARNYFIAAGDWYSVAKLTELQADCICSAAETYVKEAQARMTSPNPSHMVAASFLENAIQQYRLVPKAMRGKRNVNQRMEELHRLMNEHGENVMAEMVTIQSESIDVSDIVRQVTEMVSGKSLSAAMYAFTQIFQPQSFNTYRQLAEKSLNAGSIISMISADHVSSDGRVVAKRPGMSSNGPAAPENAETLRAEMVKHYVFDISMGVRAQIYPALQVLLREHRFFLSDLIQLASESPIVPPDRIQLIGRALYFGFEEDFETALHLCAPQIENVVRVRLKRNRVKTSRVDPGGIETENGLSTLADLPEFTSIFGDDLAFEIRSIFCDAYGPNLRNDVAHGLLDDESCSNTPSVYAWWFLLKLVFSDFVAASLRRNAAVAAAATPAEQKAP